MRILGQGSVWIGVIVLTIGRAELRHASASEARLSRTNLLEFIDANGQIQPVMSVPDWEVRRSSILSAMEEVMGPLPDASKRCPLEVQIEEEIDRGDYLQRRLTYQSEPGSRVPAYLLIPKSVLGGAEKAAGVLCLHPTNPRGHDVVVGLVDSPNRGYGVELAKRGYVCMAPPYPLLANYHPDLKALGYTSGTMKAIWDNIRALDLLETLEFVKKGRFGAIGHSLGGHNSVYTAAFDDRIKVIVSSCGLDSYQDYMAGNIQGWTSERYMPRLLEYPLADIPFDFYEIIGALAPRVCFLSAPTGDDNFQWWSVGRIVRRAEPIYQLYGLPDNLRVQHPDCGHDFPSEMRELAYRLLDEHLAGRKAPAGGRQ